jgi:hypothetical protein
MLVQPMRFQRGQIVIEGRDFGIILQSGMVTYDVLWVGGSTMRYRYEHGRDVRLVTRTDMLDEHTAEHLRHEAESAIAERRRGARIRRGQVSPRR